MISKKHLNKIIDKAILASFNEGKINSRNVNLLVKNFKSMNLSDAIFTLSGYLKGLKRVLMQQTMVIESVIPLSSVQIKNIKSKISRLFTVTDSQVTINPYILGGLKIRVGDTVLDYSVRNKLNQISEAIING